MRVCIVGFPYSGKTTLFTAIAGVPRGNLHVTDENLAAVKVPEPRLDWLEAIYKPKRRTEASIDFVDLPGSTEGESEHAGLTKHLPTLRQADALLMCVRAFANDSVVTHGGRVDAERDVRLLRDEMLLADLEICANRLDKLEKALTKPSKDKDQQKHEQALLLRCRECLESEKPMRSVVQPGEEEKMIRSFGFLTLKPTLLVINVGEADVSKAAPFSDPSSGGTFAACATLESDLMLMDPADRPAFMKEYGVQALVRDRIIRGCYDALGMICFLTAGEDECRAWPIANGTTAVDAAGKIHSDLARGFIKAETVAYGDLHAAGSMRDAKAAGKVRMEPKGYVVQDGDVMNIKFAV